MIDIAPHLHIAQGLARSYFLPGYEQQDVEQEAMIGLWLAARDFRPEIQPNFEAFAVICIKRRLNQSLKLATRMKHGPLNESEREERHVSRSSDDPAVILEAREELLRLLTAIKEDLSPIERRVLIGTINGLSNRVINEEVGGTVTSNNEGRKRFRRVDNALRRALKKLAA